ncbi:MAG: Mor transcription activator family protein [Burkholderiales bacterium]
MRKPAQTSPTPKLDQLIAAEPDLVDRIFEYILQTHPDFAGAVEKLKKDVRAEFSGSEHYVRTQDIADRQARVHNVLRLFNGRNASEIARTLQIGRATVYRIIKQAGRPTQS